MSATIGAAAPSRVTPPRLRPGSDIATMTARSLRHALRTPDSLLIGLMLPVMIMILFTTVFGGAVDAGIDRYIDYVVPGIILLCAGYGASMTAISVTKDVTEGIVDRFRTMRVLASAVVIGHVLVSVLRNLVSTVLVLATAMALGFRPAAGVGAWLGIGGILALFILAMSWLSAAVGLVVRSVDAASAFSFFLLFLPYLSSAFVPVGTLPAWLRGVAEHQPFTPLTESLRGLLLGTGAGTHLGPAVAWCLGILVVAAVASAWLWRIRRR